MLSAEAPVPANSGFRQRTLHLARQLSALAEVDMACLGQVPAHSPEPFRMTAAGAPRSRMRAFATALTVPYLAAKFDSPDLHQVAARPGWDTIQAELPFLVPPARTGPVPIVLDAHNVESELVASLSHTAATPWERARWRWEAAKTTRYERSVLARVAAVCATSEEDGAALRRLGASRVVTVPNGVDTASIGYQPPSPGAVLAYTGHFGYRPNVTAATELVTGVFPRVRARFPNASLTLIGRDPPATLRQLGGDSVEVTGAVDDVLGYLRRARALVVPLRAGSGTRLKVLEAMAAGVPVVSTRLGVNGLGLVDGEHVLIGESAADLAGHACRLIEDDDLARHLAEAARDLAVRSFDWSVVARPLLELHADLAAESRPRA